MDIQFRADNAFTRKHARLIWRQFFPAYLQTLWLRWFLFLFMLLVLVEIISLLLAADAAEWLRGWGLPDAFVDWPYASLCSIIGVWCLILLAEAFVRWRSRRAEAQFTSLAPPEEARISVSETTVTMHSASAQVAVPLAKVTGLALSKQALAIGFSGTGMILPRSVFATPAEEVAFIRAVAKGMGEEALQRSTPDVQKMVSASL
jgi:hypothetical protein